VIVHGLHARNVFDCDNQRLALSLVGKDAEQIDFALPDDDTNVGIRGPGQHECEQLRRAGM
jgi:hypothetical protein